MGTDKAFVDVRGRPLAVVGRDALLRAGASEVVAVGGDGDRLRGLGLRPVEDRWPGEGPLAGLISGLAAVATPAAVVLACDLLAVDAHCVRRVLHALSTNGVDVAVPVVDGRSEVLAAAWWTATLAHLEQCFAAGYRAPSRALRGLRVHEVRGLPAGALVDADSPADLERYARP